MTHLLGFLLRLVGNFRTLTSLLNYCKPGTARPWAPSYHHSQLHYPRQARGPRVLRKCNQSLILAWRMSQKMSLMKSLYRKIHRYLGLQAHLGSQNYHLIVVPIIPRHMQAAQCRPRNHVVGRLIPPTMTFHKAVRSSKARSIATDHDHRNHQTQNGAAEVRQVYTARQVETPQSVLNQKHRICLRCGTRFRLALIPRRFGTIRRCRQAQSNLARPAA